MDSIMARNDETVQVELPQRLIDRVDRRLPYTEWDDPASYITYVLEEVLASVEDEVSDAAFEPVDEAAVKDRLQSLGYLNE